MSDSSQPSTPPEQGPKPTGRAAQGPRDLLLTIGALVIVVLAIAGLAGQCDFSPDGPTIDPQTTPSVSVPQELRINARSVEFPLRAADPGPDWRATSTKLAPVGTTPDAAQVLRINWISPDDNYLQLSQSDAVEEALVESETGKLEAPRGAVDVAGETWVDYPGRRSERAWVADLGDVRILITGSGTEAEFAAMATAVLAAKPE